MQRRRFILALGLVPLATTVGCGSATLAGVGSSTPAAPTPATAVAPVAAPTPRAASDGGSLRKIAVDFAAKYAHYAPHFIAAEKGYYADEGIQLDIITGGVAALLAGQASFTTSPSSLLTAILKGADMKVLYTHLDRPNYQLWSSQADIKSLKDLQGKTVGVYSRGDTMEIATRLLLVQAGLDPNGVAYTPVTSGQVMLAAVEAGSLSAGMLTAADVVNLKKQGPKGSLLADTAKEVKMLFTGVGTSNKLLKEDPKLVEGFLRGTIKGREYFKRYKEETVAILTKYNGGSAEVNAADYDSVLVTMTPDGTLPDDVAATDAKVRAAVIGIDQIRPLAEIYDYSFVRKIYAELKASNWQPTR